ncbi:uncharacterized protein LOC122364283 [Amphibalanus amphitrite]|uniref:uncharacterized protein LOC122364283 n=1 Tax=Amphibalanus amphitrite TaxID=1232801 RepID=UPI001C92A231|nr:uncharacterized protein LOC122364283 [Amphibalanus amphitrite]
MAALRRRSAPPPLLRLLPLLLPLLVTVLVVGAAVASAAVPGSMRVRPDRYCLACLCTATSNCSPSIGCHRRGADTVCGPLLLSAAVWRRARLTDSSFAATFAYLGFRECAADAECAGAVLGAYLEAEAADCDGDGMVGCTDFGVLTVAGPDGCRRGAAALSRPQQAQMEALHRCQREVAYMLRVPKANC